MEKFFREIKPTIAFEKRKNINFPAHMHDDIELIFVGNGRGLAFCNGKKYEISDNSFFLVFPNQVHHYTDFCDGEYLMLILKPSELLSYNRIFTEGEPESAVCCFNGIDDDGIIYLLKTAFGEYHRDGNSKVISAYLTAFFGKLIGHYRIEKSRVSSDTVLQILEYCGEHYREEISVESVSKSLHISKSTVSHIFSSRIGMNFCDYINSLRLSSAVQFLKNKNYLVTEISNMSGFCTIRSFNRAFLKHYGISPSMYRKNLYK